MADGAFLYIDTYRREINQNSAQPKRLAAHWQIPPLRAGQRLQGGDLSGRRKIDGTGRPLGIGRIPPLATGDARSFAAGQSGSLSNHSSSGFSGLATSPSMAPTTCCETSPQTESTVGTLLCLTGVAESARSARSPTFLSCFNAFLCSFLSALRADDIE